MANGGAGHLTTRDAARRVVKCNEICRRLIPFACGATLLAWSDVGLARGSAQLHFVQRADGARCPDETALRRCVGAQLGYDPFDAKARTRIEATVERKASRFHGRVTIRREGASAGDESSTRRRTARRSSAHSR